MIKKITMILGLVSSFSFSQITTKPNILFIAVDDLKPTINSFGDVNAITPNIDRIVANGTKFLNNQCQWSVCGPTRASLLSGKRADFTKVYDQQTQLRAANPNLVTLPQYLKANGYTVIGGGKVFDPNTVDSGHDAVSWSSTFKKTEQMPYNATFGKPVWSYYQSPDTEAAIAAALQQANGVVSVAEKIYKPVYEIGVDAAGNSLPDDAYNDGATAKWAETQLNNLKTSTTPFFLAVGFKHPHLPFNAPKSYYELYDKNTLPLPDYTGVPTNSAAMTVRSSGELGAFTTPGMSIVQEADGRYTISEADQRTLIHAYYASVSYVDAQVGKLLNKLQSTGLANNTIVVLFGDHGYNLGDHKLWTKHNLLEQANNAPLVIYDPRNPSVVKTVNAPTEHIDMYPTICSLAGLTIPNDIDGTNLQPLMTGESTSVKDFAVSEFNTNGQYGYSFRTDRYRYIVWLNTGKLSTDKPTTADYYSQEMYDLVLDPNETNNIYNAQDYTVASQEIAQKVQNYFQNGGGIKTDKIPMVTNPDFENSVYNNGWTLALTAPSAATISNAGTVDANAGNGAAKVNVTVAGAENTVRLMNKLYTTSLAGKTIRITLYAKSQLGTEQFKMRIYNKVNGANSFITSSAFVPTTAYNAYSADFVIPANTTESRLDLLLGQSVGTFYFDDVVVKDITQVTSGVLKLDVNIVMDNTNDKVGITTEGKITGAKLYDFNGKQVNNVTIANNKVDVSAVSAGIYNLVLELDGIEVSAKKIVVNK